MNMNKNNKTKPTDTTIRETKKIVVAIVSDILKRRFDDLAKEFVLKNFPEYADSLSVAKARPVTRQRNLRRKAPTGRKQRPRNERLTDRYHGVPEDFERAPVACSAEVQSTVRRVLALAAIDRDKHYVGDLRLSRYSHHHYQWYGTVGKHLLGHPIRRFFATLEEAVTWLETVRERAEGSNLNGNVPLGGVRRSEFSMSWQGKKNPGGSNVCQSLSSSSSAPTPIPPSNGWTAERRAKMAAKQKAKRAYHSVDSAKQKRMRQRATTAEILAGAFLPDVPCNGMPGNNVGTALESGSTAATSGGANGNSAEGTPVNETPSAT